MPRRLLPGRPAPANAVFVQRHPGVRRAVPTRANARVAGIVPPSAVFAGPLQAATDRSSPEPWSVRSREPDFAPTARRRSRVGGTCPAVAPIKKANRRDSAREKLKPQREMTLRVRRRAARRERFVPRRADRSLLSNAVQSSAVRGPERVGHFAPRPPGGLLEHRDRRAPAGRAEVSVRRRARRDPAHPDLGLHDLGHHELGLRAPVLRVRTGPATVAAVLQRGLSTPVAHRFVRPTAAPRPAARVRVHRLAPARDVSLPVPAADVLSRVRAARMASVRQRRVTALRAATANLRQSRRGRADFPPRDREPAIPNRTLQGAAEVRRDLHREDRHRREDLRPDVRHREGLGADRAISLLGRAPVRAQGRDSGRARDRARGALGPERARSRAVVHPRSSKSAPSE